MWSSPLFWIVFAVAIFWALGAYNRLMRLRSAVVQAFGGFDAHMVRLLALLGEFGAAHAAAPSVPHDKPPEMAALEGAANQLSASLAMARAHPLQPGAVAALVAAREVLHAAWQKAVNTLQEGDAPVEAEVAAAPQATDVLPSPRSLWQSRWDQHVQQNDQAIRVFNDAVLHYNAAIAQLPAKLLAWVFGFKAARTL